MSTVDLVSTLVYGTFTLAAMAFSVWHLNSQTVKYEDVRYYYCHKCLKSFDLHKSKSNECPDCGEKSRQLKHW